MADFDSLPYIQGRNSDDLPTKCNLALESLFKVDMLHYNFLAENIPSKTAHPRIPHHSRSLLLKTNYRQFERRSINPIIGFDQKDM